ncbi:ZN574 protein, partial [Cercotrichas coryphoeus]|nr:ZN574 protein [Cercotrichas coryphoeus]
EHRCGKPGWKFECGVCGKKSGTAARLRAHERVHGGAGGQPGSEAVPKAAPARRGAGKNLECGECKKLFSTET